MGYGAGYGSSETCTTGVDPSEWGALFHGVTSLRHSKQKYPSIPAWYITHVT